MQAIEEDGTRQRPAVMMVQVAPPRPQGGQLADHIRAAPGRQNVNRVQPLIFEKIRFWENVARASSPLTASQPSLAEADFPALSLLKPCVADSPTVRLVQEWMSKVICMGKATPVGDGGSALARAKSPPVINMIGCKTIQGF